MTAVATPKQVAWIDRLGPQQGWTPEQIDRAKWNKAAASRALDVLFAARPRTETTTVTTTRTDTVTVTDPGMYRDADGEIFKVQKSRESGRLYAKHLTPIGGKRLIDADESVVGFEFTYAAGAVYRLTPAMRMTLDEAKAFGIRFGVCCVCGAHLKDATSVALGIGPVCGGRV